MLTEYKILIPICKDSDGKPHDSGCWDDLENMFRATFGGFTKGSVVRGQWVGPDGTVSFDYSEQYFIAADTYSAVYVVAKWIAIIFDQQKIYVVRIGEASLIS